jgi:hypothetical protein
MEVVVMELSAQNSKPIRDERPQENAPTHMNHHEGTLEIIKRRDIGTLPILLYFLIASHK